MEKIAKILKINNNLEIGSITNDGNDDFISPKKAISYFVNTDINNIQYIGSESKQDEKILNSPLHPFVHAVHTAYAIHLPLNISPDLIWYLIASAASIHINENCEELRTKFVNHKEKETIEIRRDDFVLNSDKNAWNEVIDEFKFEISKRTNNNVADLFQANFTSTNEYSKIVSQIVLMDSMKSYFDFKISTLCGIPEIRLIGTKQDWLNVKSKTEELLELMPRLKKVWLESLNEILNHFIDAYDDKIDYLFWNEIYKKTGGSGGPFISGWIIALFPYLDHNEENPYVFSEKKWKNINDNDCGITTNSFYYHMNNVPFIWNYFGNEIKMIFIGGLVGIRYETDKSLTPLFAYSIVQDKESADE